MRLASVPPASAPTQAGALPRVMPRRVTSHWSVVATLGGKSATWIERRAGITLLRFDQRLVHLVLHAGSADGGTGAWAQGNHITSGERPSLVAAVNGGFKLTYTEVGFMLRGHTAARLGNGLASLVTYSDGSTNIGAWNEGVPDHRRMVVSVLQNQRLLVDRGVAAPTISDCVIRCWGGTIGLATAVARSSLGIDAHGRLIWAAGEHLSPAELASSLIGAGAVRAIELDINPWWVAGYLYTHRGPVVRAIAVVPRQRGVSGTFLRRYSRDFLTFVAG